MYYAEAAGNSSCVRTSRAIVLFEHLAHRFHAQHQPPLSNNTAVLESLHDNNQNADVACYMTLMEGIIWSMLQMASA